MEPYFDSQPNVHALKVPTPGTFPKGGRKLFVLSHSQMAKRLRWLGFLLLFFFSACDLTPMNPLASDSSPSPVSQAFPFSASLTFTPESKVVITFGAASPTLTAVLAPGDMSKVEDNSLEAPPTPEPDPLRFIFPTPAPAPVSAWRPPLYPTPWALSPHDHFYFARPIAADEINWPLWDYRYGGSFFEDVIHTGIDIVVRKGTPVLAAGSGKVIWAGYGVYRGFNDPSDPYGLAVVIQHDFGYQGQTLYTVYGHLDQVDVLPGQYVEVGQVLGMSGETGHATGPHLHFEVRLGLNGFFTTRNPELWLAPPQGWGVLAGRVTDASGRMKTGQEVIVHSLSTGQNWMAKTYGSEAINSDAYYRENLVISDLPAGWYEIRIPHDGFNHIMEIQILPGVVNYFTYRSFYGFSTTLPDESEQKFTPPVGALPSETLKTTQTP